MRPSSARYSFPRGHRDSDLASKSPETPGPAAYDVADYASALGQAAAVVGRAVRNTDPARPCEYQADIDLEEPPEPVPVPDSSDFRYPAQPSAVFGTEAKCDDDVKNSELVRVNPECRYGKTGPGFVYTPNERKTRPSSAPVYSIPRKQTQERAPSRQSQTPAHISPQFYYAEEPAMGVQRDSRRRTRPASSFSRAGRFPAAKQAEGEISEECKRVESAFGGGGGRKHRAPAATFGSSTRESSRKARAVRAAGDRHPGERLGPPRIPHPQVAPQKEILRYNPGEYRR